MTIDCGLNRIVVTYANYGRTESMLTHECGGGNEATDCRSGSEYFTNLCNGNHSCTLDKDVVKADLGDPCGGVHKYMEIQYYCGMYCTIL